MKKLTKKQKETIIEMQHKIKSFKKLKKFPEESYKMKKGNYIKDRLLLCALILRYNQLIDCLQSKEVKKNVK